jgi:hypothetical protein
LNANRFLSLWSLDTRLVELPGSPFLFMSSFTFLEPVLILTILAIPSLALRGAYRALLESGKSGASIRRSMLLLGVLLFGWLAVAVFLACLGTFRSAIGQPFPSIGLAILGPIVLGSLFMRKSETVQEINETVPQSRLIGFQAYRIVGVVFLILLAGGLLPAIFALPAGYGDLLVGLSAIALAYRLAYRSQTNSGRLIALWNWCGIFDLVIAVGTGFLTAPTRFQIFSHEAPNFLIGTFPLVMIPIYLVPISILLHLASLSKLRRGKRSQRVYMHECPRRNA